METPDEATKAEEAIRLTKIFDTIWEGIILGDSKWNVDKSCFKLAQEYRDSGKTSLECAENFINWQKTKAGISGFGLGLPGGLWALAAVPADFVSVSYLQLRMVAVIGLLFGWDVRSDQMRVVAYSALLGAGAGEAIRDVGVKAATGWGKIWIKKIPMAVLSRLNKFLPGRNFIIKGLGKAGTKAGSTFAINLSRLVPLLGGVVGGGINVFVTQQIGARAIRALKDGPPPSKGGEDKPEDKPIIDGAAVVVENFVATLSDDDSLTPSTNENAEEATSEDSN